MSDLPTIEQPRRPVRRGLRLTPSAIATIKVNGDWMVRDVLTVFYMRFFASKDVREFHRQYHATSPLHSRRSPRLDDLRALQEAGLALRARDGNRKRTSELLVEPLGRIAAILADYETFVSLYEQALADGQRFGTRSLRQFATTCDIVLRAPATEDSQDLRDRFEAVRQQVLERESHVPASLQVALELSGSVPFGRIETLKQIPAAERTLTQQALLVSMLLHRCQRVDRIELLVEIIDTLDASLPALSQEAPQTPEGSGPQLLMWLSVLIAAKSAYSVDHDRPFEPVEEAVARAVNIGDAIWDPNALYDRLAGAALAKNRQTHSGFVWSVQAIGALWRFDFVGGEALRRTVFEAAVTTAETGQVDWLDQNDLGVRLLRCLSQCEGMWTDPAYRATLIERCRGIVTMINEPRRMMVRGLYHLAAGEEEEAEALFAQRRGEAYNGAFNGSGHITFIPTKDAAVHLEGDTLLDPRFLPENCGFRFEKKPDCPPYLLLVTTCADPNYLNKYYHAYTSSLLKLDHKSRLHLHLLGRVEDVDPSIIALIHEEPRISLSSEEPPIQMPYYYATARFLRAPLFQEVTRSALLLTDIDAKFQESPNRLFQQWNEAGDVGLRLYDKIRWFPAAGMYAMKTPRIESWTTLNASCVFLKRSYPARHFARDVSRVAHFALDRHQNNGNSNWWIDQNVIFAALRPTMERIEGLSMFNLLDVGIPFGAYQVDAETAVPPRGQHPSIPVLPAPERTAAA